MATKDYLYRYTDLPSLIHILTTRQITLLDPQTWDDKNDSFFMSEYKRRCRAKTLLALCFSQVRETYHHWRVFSHGSHGVCIRFNKQKFLNQFNIDRRIKHRSVTYKKRNTFVSPATVELEELPFLKRAFYSDEKEYRVIYVNESAVHPTKDYAITLDWIDRCEKLPVVGSSVVVSERWKALVIAAVERSTARGSR
jgi:Protein of unknown function (DUF2971)